MSSNLKTSWRPIPPGCRGGQRWPMRRGPRARACARRAGAAARPAAATGPSAKAPWSAAPACLDPNAQAEGAPGPTPADVLPLLPPGLVFTSWVRNRVSGA